MINDPLTLDKALEILNSIAKADPKAAEALVETRVPCNKALADHPSVQISGGQGTPDGPVYQVGFLGAINGLFGTYEDGDKAGWGPIAASWDVVCPDCGKVEGEGKEGDLCPECGKALELGPFLGFIRTQED